jgi:hypothetical protein
MKAHAHARIGLGRQSRSVSCSHRSRMDGSAVQISAAIATVGIVSIPDALFKHRANSERSADFRLPANAYCNKQ